MQVRDGTGSNVILFPGAACREQGDVELVHGGAPSRSMVEAFLEETGLAPRDVIAGMSAEIGYVMGCFERGYGHEAAVMRYREALDAETSRAAALIRTFQATADTLMLLERSIAARDRVSAADRSRLVTLRRQFRDEVIAARAAADVAIATSVAMTAFVREGSFSPRPTAEPRQMLLFAAG